MNQSTETFNTLTLPQISVLVTSKRLKNVIKHLKVDFQSMAMHKFLSSELKLGNILRVKTS